jgi:ABC-2 type transport system permease protein
MTNVFHIMRRELQAYLSTPLGYIITASVLLIEGLLFNWYVLGAEPKPSTVVLELFFYIASGTTMTASVFLSMRLLAEDRQTGSLVLLMTSPLREWDIVLGKWLSATVFLMGINALSLYMPLLIFVNGKVSAGHIVAGYLGLTLLGAAAAAIGTLGSAVTKHQVLAVIVSAAMLLFMLLVWMGSAVAAPPLDTFFQHLALYNKHFVPFQRGVLGLSHVVYYGTVAFLFLLAATKVLEARRWR